MIDIKEIEKYYKKLSDSAIKNIAINDSKKLKSEVLNIIQSEILRRNLNKNLITWVKAETNSFSKSEKQLLKRKIENLECPICKQKDTKLSGQEFTTVISMIIGCDISYEKKIICKKCGRKYRIKSFLKTLFLGWWSQEGIIKTPYVLTKELIKAVFYNKEKISDEIINDFLEKNTGKIRIRGMDNTTLKNLISNYNRQTE